MRRQSPDDDAWKECVMKYTNSIEIALPRERVAQLLADPAHLPKWLRGLVLHEPVNGIQGQLGTKSRVVMQSGQRRVEFTETITRREPVDLNEIPKSASSTSIARASARACRASCVIG
jgi:hypothetical protein